MIDWVIEYGFTPYWQYLSLTMAGLKVMLSFIVSSNLSLNLDLYCRENMVKNGICVANHTSPLDVIILSCDNCYALVNHWTHLQYIDFPKELQFGSIFFGPKLKSKFIGFLL